jgi:hypothetical protein
MKKKSIIIPLLIIGIGILAFSCVKNTTENVALDTTVVGKWEGLIVPIIYSTISFSGAKVFLDIAAKDSAFRMIARNQDTTKNLSAAIKDTILVLTGKWSMKNAKDSIILQCSYCRVVDTSQKILYDRPVDVPRIPLPVNITKSEDGLILWKFAFIDLTPLVPLLGLTIPDGAQGFLKMLNIQLQKMSQN